MEEKKSSPAIVTTRQLSALRQIHAAIEHLRSGQWECAITLALAAEGQLPPTGNVHLVKALREHAPDLAKDGTLNLYRDWLKHWSKDKPDEIEISAFSVTIAIMRAISKFYAVYGKSSAEMKTFGGWCRQRGYLLPEDQT